MDTYENTDDLGENIIGLEFPQSPQYAEALLIQRSGFSHPTAGRKMVCGAFGQVQPVFATTSSAEFGIAPSRSLLLKDVSLDCEIRGPFA